MKSDQEFLKGIYEKIANYNEKMNDKGRIERNIFNSRKPKRKTDEVTYTLETKEKSDYVAYDGSKL